MLGGILQIVGVLALLVGGAELVVRYGRRRPIATPDPLWPRIEPELEQLRRKGAL